MLIPFNYLFIFKNRISGIVHVGAHELEELPEYLNKRVKNIIWIEANPAKYEFIEDRLNKHKDMILGKFAAGSKKDKLFLNISNNGQSSSILPLGTHKTSYPNIFYTSKVSVDVLPFDSWAKNMNIRKYLYNFINIDVQGYELEVLKGMEKQLNLVDYIYLEVNFREVYINCSQIKEIDKFLSNFNFKRVGTYKTYKGWGDAIYVKNFVLLNKIYYFFLIPILKIILLPLKIYKRIKFIIGSLKNKYR
jgi:FkbM family methyltransferase